MRKKAAMRIGSARGQSLVEFSIMLPLLALLLFAIIQYGMIFAAHISLRNASAVAARYATLSNTTPTAAKVQEVARAAIVPVLKPAHLQTPVVNMNVTVGGVPGGKSVQLTYDLPLIIPFVVPGQSGGTLRLSATTIMR